jgi:hypothetical protein
MIGIVLPAVAAAATYINIAPGLVLVHEGVVPVDGDIVSPTMAPVGVAA